MILITDVLVSLSSSELDTMKKRTTDRTATSNSLKAYSDMVFPLIAYELLPLDHYDGGFD